MDNLKCIIKQFSEYQKRRNLSSTTITQYATLLNKFAESVGDVSVSDLTKHDANDFLDGFSTQSDATRAQRACIMRAFFQWAHDEELTERNLGASIIIPKQEKKEIDVMTEVNAMEVLSKAYDTYKKGGVYGLRDYLIVLLFLNTGIRRQELLTITAEDVDEPGCRVLIHGKGSKQRFVYIDANTVELIRTYCKLNSIENGAIIFNISVRSVNRIINKYMEMADCKKHGRSAHGLRKRFATSAYKETLDIYSVSKALGHSTIVTSERYVQVAQDEIRKAFNAVKFKIESENNNENN